MAVLFFQKEELLDATIHVRSRIIPGVIWVVLPYVMRCYGEKTPDYSRTLSVSDHVSVR